MSHCILGRRQVSRAGAAAAATAPIAVRAGAARVALRSLHATAAAQLYFKRMELGKVVERFSLSDRADFRRVLRERFSMELQPVPRPERMVEQVAAYKKAKQECAAAKKKGGKGGWLLLAGVVWWSSSSCVMCACGV